MQTLRAHSLLTGLAVIGLAVFIILNWGPLAASDPGAEAGASAPIVKSAAIAKAEAFAARHFGVSGLKSIVIYKTLSDFSGYLQKEHLYKSYIKSWRDTTPIDYYDVNLVNNETRRQFSILLNMENGKVIGWSSLPASGSRHRASAAKAAADNGTLQDARSWLKALGYKPDTYRLIADGKNNGTWIFESRAKLGQAGLRLDIRYADGVAESFASHVQMPASYTRWMQRQKNLALIMSNLYLFFSFLLAVGSLIAAVLLRKHIRVHWGLWVSLVFLVIYSFNNYNSYPGFKSIGTLKTSTMAALSSFITMNLVTFALAASIYAALLGGEALWKQSGRVMLSRFRDPFFGQDIVQGMIRGYALAMIIMGAQAVLFRIEGGLFDVWSTNDPTQSPYNLFYPVLFPVMAWAAAINEEAVFRLFGIGLFKKLTRNTFIAVLIPSMLWALGHAAYPIYPFYTRLIEVTVLGLIFGFAFLRFGFYTTLFAHAIMDSTLMSLTLTNMGKAYIPLVPLYIVLPGLIALFIAYLHRRSGRRPDPKTVH